MSDERKRRLPLTICFLGVGVDEDEDEDSSSVQMVEKIILNFRISRKKKKKTLFETIEY